MSIFIASLCLFAYSLSAPPATAGETLSPTNPAIARAVIYQRVDNGAGPGPWTPVASMDEINGDQYEYIRIETTNTGTIAAYAIGSQDSEHIETYTFNTTGVLVLFSAQSEGYGDACGGGRLAVALELLSPVHAKRTVELALNIDPDGIPSPYRDDQQPGRECMNITPTDISDPGWQPRWMHLAELYTALINR